ncbi:MAG: hypothetical protein VXZ81_07105 [Pseudomonadota bacterium]|nr:hypothetical protein [Pseudomonadota bacterium]
MDSVTFECKGVRCQQTLGEKTWQTIQMSEQDPHQNPFLALNFFEFAAISVLVLTFFPMSLVLCWVAFGKKTTGDLIEAIIKDWVQTVLILAGLAVLLFGGLVWGLIEWIA